MGFCTAVNCMDGRVQAPVIQYLRERFEGAHVDHITEAGPVGVLAADPESLASRAIYRKIDVSMNAHGSRVIAVVAHHDCAGNPKPREEQLNDLIDSVDVIRERYPGLQVISLWVNEDWQVEEVESSTRAADKGAS
jgi:hypothetical protein